MGDNLKAASRFVSQSISSLDRLATAPTLSQDRVLDNLADLQRGAKAMRARAIYRAAQTAVDMLHKGLPEEKVQSELSVVRSLVVQYQNGLQEILGQETPKSSGQYVVSPPAKDAVIDFSSRYETGRQPAPDAAAMMIGQQVDMTQEVGFGQQADIEPEAGPNLLNDLMMPLAAPIMPDIAAGSDLAAMVETHPSDDLNAQLMPLVQFAPEAEQRDALRRLSRLHSALSLSAIQAEPSEISTAHLPKQRAERPKMVVFETLMPELTNVVLTTARHLGKTVSISYAATATELQSERAEAVRAALSDLCVILVTRSLEDPDIRRARGESGAGHISIMASIKSGHLDLTVESTGRNITTSDLDIASWNTLKNMGAELSFSREDGRMCLAVSGLRAKPLGARKSLSSPALEHAS